MQQRDDYVFGSHHYWLHFGCGFVLGAALGAHATLGVASKPVVVVVSLVGGLLLGRFAGRWGDRGWKRVSELLRLWWGIR